MWRGVSLLKVYVTWRSNICQSCALAYNSSRDTTRLGVRTPVLLGSMEMRAGPGGGWRTPRAPGGAGGPVRTGTPYSVAY